VKRLFSSTLVALVATVLVLAGVQAAGQYLEATGPGISFRTTNPVFLYAGTMTFTNPANSDANMNLNTGGDGQFRINSKDFDGTSGTAEGFQSKPNQTADGASVTGAEISPRYSDAGGGALIGMKVDPLLKTATTAHTISAIRAIEINPDFPLSGSAYTVTNDVSAIRVFPNFGAGHTFSGDKSLILAAAPNTSDWDYLLSAETGTNNWVVVGGGTYSTADGYFLVKVHDSTYRVPFFAAVD
jgi:hypothetical protein